MAIAVCTVCGTQHRWRARRGTQLAALQCLACGGHLKRPETRTPRRTNAGKRIRRCPLCGRRTFQRFVTPDVDYRRQYMPQEKIAAGTDCCWRCFAEVVPADKPAGWPGYRHAEPLSDAKAAAEYAEWQAWKDAIREAAIKGEKGGSHEQ